MKVFRKKKVFKVGGSRVVAMDLEWAKKTENRSPSGVAMGVTDDMVVICPEASLDPRFGESKSGIQSSRQMRSMVECAYIAGYDEIVLKVDSADVSSVLEELKKKLGFKSPQWLDSHTVKIRFPIEEVSIVGTIRNCKDVFSSTRKMILNALQNYPEGNVMTETEGVGDHEELSDKWLFEAKKALSEALLFPIIVQDKLKIANSLDIMNYHTILLTFERILDIQNELRLLLARLEETQQRNLPMKEMAKCYDFSSHVVQNALENLENEATLLSILEAHEILDGNPVYGRKKANERTSLPPEIKDYLERRKEIQSSATKLKEPLGSILFDMDGKIHGTIGLASNIAQAAMNMLGNAKILRVARETGKTD
jgi:hypothetical protein